MTARAKCPGCSICAYIQVIMPSRRAYLRRARHWIANRGWRGFFEQILWRLQLGVQGKPIPGRERSDNGPHPFDREFGVDTTGLVWGEALDGAKAYATKANYWATGYYGIAPSAFKSLAVTGVRSCR